jgi:pimeloyl-ACP methyl ester carboxylesterase
MATVASGTDIGPGALKRRRRACVEGFKLTLSDGRIMSGRRWDGPVADTLVLLHGLMDSSEGWNEICDRVGGRRIAFDLAGFGDSDPLDRGSIAGYANDVVEGLQTLGVQRFTLVGHSLGGAVATAVAEMIPDRIDALVLLAPAGFGRIRLAEAISVPIVRNIAQLAMPMALSSRMVVTAGYMAMVANRRSPADDTVQRIVDQGGRLVDGAREATRAVVEAGRSRQGFHRRRVRYDGPVFAVWGDRDRIVPVDHRHAVGRAFDNPQVAVWTQMGHHPQHERLDDLLELLERAKSAARSTPTGTIVKQARAA